MESVKSSFTLLTYNVKNMFDNVNADKTKGTGEKPVWEMNAAAKVVRKSEADIVTNQEVENIGVYDQWGRGQLENSLPHRYVGEGNDKRGINLAAMSRYPIEEVVSHKDALFPLNDESALTGFSRDLLRVDFNIQGETVSVYTTHSQSQREGSAKDVFIGDNQRIAEAKAIKSIITREMSQYPNRLYIVTGDFNDGTEDESLQALMNGPGPKLIDTLEGRADEQRMTWPSDPNKKGKFRPEQFDHVLIPESMKHRLIDSQVLDYGDLTARASDHKPIQARFRLGDS